jgi:uridine phosphorylase
MKNASPRPIREPHFTPEKILARLGVGREALAPCALVPGSRERAELLRRELETSKRVLSFLDYEMYTGEHEGMRLTVGNGGRYAADAAITTEILCAAGARTLVRLGSCGSLQRKIKIGDLVIVTGALRGEGASAYYVPRSFSTLPDAEVVEALVEAAKSLKVRYHLGWVYTTDALFQETPELIAELEQQGVAAIDMVTSSFLTVARVRQRKAGAVLAVSDECCSGTWGFRHPRFLKAEEVMVQLALRAARAFS